MQSLIRNLTILTSKFSRDLSRRNLMIVKTNPLLKMIVCVSITSGMIFMVNDYHREYLKRKNTKRLRYLVILQEDIISNGNTRNKQYVSILQEISLLENQLDE